MGKVTATDATLPTCYKIHNLALVQTCCTKILCGRLHVITQNAEKYLGVILDPGMVQKIYVILMDVLSFFFLYIYIYIYKEIAQQIFRETYTNTEQYKTAEGSFFSFRSFVRSWTPVRTNKIYSFMSVLRGTIKEGEGERRRRERNISNGIYQCDYWRNV